MGKEKQKNITTSKSIVGLQKEQIAKMNEINEEISELNKNLASGTISPEQHKKEYQLEMLKFKINNKQYECAQLQVCIEECKKKICCLHTETNSFMARTAQLTNKISEMKHNIAGYDEEDYAKYKEIFRAEHELNTVQKHTKGNSEELTSLKENLEKYLDGLAAINKDIAGLESEIEKLSDKL